MKKYLKMSLYVAIMGMMSLGMASCGDDDNGGGDDSVREATLKQIVSEYTAKTVIPTYEGMATAAIELYNCCYAMYEAGAGNVTTAQVEAAGEAWKEAREYWERSEAWLYGPAGDYDVDPHIDSWPLSETQLNSLLNDAAQMAQMDAEGVFAATQDYGVLGFHALEYMLFQLSSATVNLSTTSMAHDTDYTTEELKYITGVAGDLRNQCVILEAAWKGEDNISSAKQAVLDAVRAQTAISSSSYYEQVLSDLENGLCYADQMNNPVEGSSSDFVNYLACAQTMIVDGIQNIANEVGNIKIGNPTGMGLSSETEYDPYYIESPYSLNSINDFLGNIISIENAYRGFQSSKSYNSGETLIKSVNYSLSTYVASLDATLDTRVKNAIETAYSAISQMGEPFAYTAQSGNGYDTINQNAIEACNDLNDIFDEVLTLLQAQR